MWPQNIVPITLSRQISLDAHYVCSAVVGYCYPHHDTSTAKSVIFLYAGGGEMLISTSVYGGSFMISLVKKKRDTSLIQIQRQFLKVQTFNV